MKWWKIVNQSNDNAELLLYGSIGDDWFSENSSKNFANALHGLNHMGSITIRINSPGGEISAAQAIYNLIKNHSAYITVVIDGLAASAASLIAMAGDKIIMPNCALMMIHNPMSYISGDSGDMLHAAEVLEKFKETMIAVYAERTGKDSETLSKMMDKETWFTAEEALAEGFIDEIDGNSNINLITNSNMLIVNGLHVDLKKYKNIPIAVMSAVRNTKNPNKEENFIMSAEQLKTDNPTVYNQIYNAGIAAERERIKGIDSINAVGYEVIKNKAKYESFEQAGKVAIDIINAQATKISGVASGLADDIQASNVNNIPMGNAPEQEPSIEEANAKNLIQKAINAANANIKGR